MFTIVPATAQCHRKIGLGNGFGKYLCKIFGRNWRYFNNLGEKKHVPKNLIFEAVHLEESSTFGSSTLKKYENVLKTTDEWCRTFGQARQYKKRSLEDRHRML